jgi:hypothetical protein
LPRRVKKRLQILAVVASFVPGLLCLIVPVTAGHDQPLAAVGAFFLAGPALIWWGTFRLVDEVRVTGDRLDWVGLRCAGSAPLTSLEAVKPARLIGGAVLTFVVEGKRRFEIAPARGIEMFLDALRNAQPRVDIEFPPRLRRFGRLQYGTFEDYRD